MHRCESTHRFILASFALGFALCAVAAYADQPESGWDVTLGGGVASLPTYPGSNGQTTRALPLVNVTYGRFFLGGDTGGTGAGAGALGINLYQDEHWRVGAIASVGLISERKESDDSRLRGLGDIDATPRVGGFASYSLGWLTAAGSVTSDVGGNREGTVAKFGVTARYQPTASLILNAGPSVTWGDGRYMQTFFGVDDAQSLASGLPRYTAKSGVSSVGVGVGANYRFDRKWSLGIRASTGRLQSDARNGPITQDTTQNTVALFAAYHF